MTCYNKKVNEPTAEALTRKKTVTYDYDGKAVVRLTADKDEDMQHNPLSEFHLTRASNEQFFKDIAKAPTLT